MGVARYIDHKAGQHSRQFHMRVSKGVMDPVTVNALVLDSGEDQAIFLSCDIVVLRNGLQDLVREKLAQCAPEIPAMKI